MTYSLKEWTNPRDGRIRLYVGGTTRDKVYLIEGRDAVSGEPTGILKWSSRTHDTPHKFQTGDHYGKVRKDEAAAGEVAKAFGLELGGPNWQRALDIARSGVELEG